MKSALTTVLLLTLIGMSSAQCQETTPAIKVDSLSSFVWNGPVCHQGTFQVVCDTNPDYNGPAISSLVEDPLNGRKVHKLTYQGVEVASDLSYSIVPGFSKVREFIVANITVVNMSDFPVEVSEANATLSMPSQKDFEKRTVGACPYIWSDPKKPLPVSTGTVPPHSSGQYSILMAAESGHTNMQRWSADSNVYDVSPIRYAIKAHWRLLCYPQRGEMLRRTRMEVLKSLRLLNPNPLSELQRRYGYRDLVPGATGHERDHYLAGANCQLH